MSNDRIESATNAPTGRDRSGVSVTGGRSNRKTIMTIAFSLIAIVIVTAGTTLSLNSFSAATAPQNTEEQGDNNKMENNNTQTAHTEKNLVSRLANTAAVFSKLAADVKASATETPAPNIETTTETANTAQPKPSKPKVNKVVTRKGDNPKTPAQLAKEAREMIEARRFAAPIMFESTQSVTSLSPTVGAVDDSLTTADFTNGVAYKRKSGGLDFLMIHGTSIPCALVTQIISDYEGIVKCQVIQDVYSANGSALLVERGSSISGTQKVALEQGKSRIFTNWSTIETPHGVSIRIDSLGTGALGAAGSEAWVDNHYAQRFGGAILLSFVDDALGALSEKLSSKDDVQFDNSTQNASDMAAKALESSINIAPTGYAYIGQRINILVARDIDMSGVYQFSNGH